MPVDTSNILVLDLSGSDDDKICNELYGNGDLVSALASSSEVNAESLAGEHLLPTNVSDITVIDLTGSDDDEVFSRPEGTTNSVSAILSSLEVSFKDSLLTTILYISAKSLVLEQGHDAESRPEGGTPSRRSGRIKHVPQRQGLLTWEAAMLEASAGNLTLNLSDDLQLDFVSDLRSLEKRLDISRRRAKELISSLRRLKKGEKVLPGPQQAVYKIIRKRLRAEKRRYRCWTEDKNNIEAQLEGLSRASIGM